MLLVRHQTARWNGQNPLVPSTIFFILSLKIGKPVRASHKPKTQKWKKVHTKTKFFQFCGCLRILRTSMFHHFSLTSSAKSRVLHRSPNHRVFRRENLQRRHVGLRPRHRAVRVEASGSEAQQPTKQQLHTNQSTHEMLHINYRCVISKYVCM